MTKIKVKIRTFMFLILKYVLLYYTSSLYDILSHLTICFGYLFIIIYLLFCFVLSTCVQKETLKQGFKHK